MKTTRNLALSAATFLVFSIASLMLCSPEREPTQVTTFNVEMFPKHEDHGRAVFDKDERLMKRFASSTGLSWSTPQIECSHYWQRETRCITSTLDHAFTSVEGATARPKAACANVGCEIEGACPVYRRRVSDHCPVTVELVD